MFSDTNNENLLDESFPADEIFDQVPSFLEYYRQNNEQRPKAAATKNANIAEKTGRAEQNQSTVSTTSSERATSSANTSQKTCDSDFTGAQSETGKSGERCMTHRQSKATSYQDIHSEYTKRRYKHISSKVGQFIAQAQAEDRKRSNANKFQRYNSMPETLTSTQTIVSSSRFNGDDSRNLEIESLLNENERLQSYNEHLHRKLDDRMCEIVKLKRNIDLIRVDLTQCQDKLKRQILNSTTIGSVCNNMLQRHSLHSLHRCITTSSTKATQTELVTSMRALNNATPTNETGGNLYSNELGNSKNDITMHPLLLNFSNDSAGGNANLHERNSSEGLGHTSSAGRATTNNSGASSDSAIEIEAAELRSPIPPSQRVEQLSRSATKVLSPKPKRYFFYEKNLRRYIALEPIHSDKFNTTDDSNTSYSDILASVHAPGAILLKKKQSLRTRLLRIFGPCARCHEPTMPLEDESAYLQVPFLNRTGDSSRS